MLFWRSFTHWIGGMGVLVLTLAITPKVTGRTSHLMRAESPGPELSRLVPRMGETAKILYLIYVALTLANIVALLLAGLPAYDACIHAFGTAGTGGFSCRNLSVGAYDSVAVDVITTVFMLMFGMNFAFYFHVLTSGLRKAARNEEIIAYLCIVGGIYMKPLKVGGSNVMVGASGQQLQNTLNNCYTYVELPSSGSNGYIKGLYAVGGSGELNVPGTNDGNADHGWTNYNNNYYLSSVVLANNNNTISISRNDLEKVTSMTYAEMADTTSDAGLLEKLNAKIDQNNEKFATVTTETASGAPLAGRYSFGSDPSLLGKDYPFPTILTQSSNVAKNGIANVHYGDWPLEGIRRPDGALPVNLDLFADYKQDKGGAVHTESLTLSGVSEGGAWSAVSADEEIVKAEVNDGTLTITALKEGNTTVTVTYTLRGDVYSLTIEVNVTAQLRLAVKEGVTTPVTVFPNATVTTPLALTDREGKELPAELKEDLALVSIDVEFDPDYFTDAAVEQDEEEGSLTLTAASGAKTGPSQMTAAYEFTYLAEEYSATSVLSLRVVDAEVEVKPLTIALDGAEKKSQEYTGTGDSEFTIRVNDSDITVTDLQIVAFEEVATEYKDVIWAAWAEEETGTQTPGILTVTAYEQSTYPYPAYASVRLQYQFTYQGSTHTMWQDLAVTVTNQKETEGVVTP